VDRAVRETTWPIKEVTVDDNAIGCAVIMHRGVDNIFNFHTVTGTAVAKMNFSLATPAVKNRLIYLIPTGKKELHQLPRWLLTRWHDPTQAREIIIKFCEFDITMVN
jgi:hypothetical protein